MTLPVSHYVLLPLPLGATLRRVDGSASLFALVIPRVQLFSLVVQPTIVVDVRVVDDAQPPCVRITAHDSRVDGAWAEQLGLNARFEIYGTTRFTWGPDARGRDAIVSVTDLRVGVDPPLPFSRIAPSVLTAVGDAVLGAVCTQLQRVFVRALAADYARWAGDAAHRAARLELAQRTDSDDELLGVS